MMQYEIVGTPFPAVVCRLAQNESMHCESNGMAWMSPNMEMDTNTGGGIGKLFGRAFSGESLVPLYLYGASGRRDDLFCFQHAWAGSAH